MRKVGIIPFLMAFLGCESFADFRSELTNFTAIKAKAVGEFEQYEIKDSAVLIALNYQSNKLYLRLTNTSETELTFLPLDINLATSEDRCSISEIYEDFVWKRSYGKKISFENKYTIAMNDTKSFFYKFSCKSNATAFLTINGLKKNNKKLELNFKLLQK